MIKIRKADGGGSTVEGGKGGERRKERRKEGKRKEEEVCIFDRSGRKIELRVKNKQRKCKRKRREGYEMRTKKIELSPQEQK